MLTTCDDGPLPHPLAVVLAAVLWLWQALKRTASAMDAATRAQSAAKQSFLRRAGEAYGYGGSSAGHIDGWRAAELPGLVPPLGQPRAPDAIVYLDYAGSALPLASQ